MSNNDISITKDIKTGRKKTWLVRWYGKYDPSTGKQSRYGKSFTTKREAERFKAELTKQRAAGMSMDQKDITLGELCDKFIDVRKGEIQQSTIRGYRDTINQLLIYFSPTISIRRIHPEHAQQFISNLNIVDQNHSKKGNKLSTSSRNKHLRQSKSIFGIAVDWEYLLRNPFEAIKQGKVRRTEWHYITPSEFKSILERTEDLATRALYSVMYGCGLRFGEAVNLLWDGQNIDFEHGAINIRNRTGSKNIPPFSIKDYEGRSVPMPKWVSDILIELQMKSKEQCPFVFISKERYQKVKGKWHRLKNEGRESQWQNRNLVNNILREFQKTCRATGIMSHDKLTIHCLRKSYACNLANSGKVPTHTLLELMGHSDIKTCNDYYLKNISANKKRAVEVLENLMGENTSVDTAGFDSVV